MVEFEGEWYCSNCGYISGANVTFQETCDFCHRLVVFHTSKDKSVTELQATNQKLVEALKKAKCPNGKCKEGKIQKFVLTADDWGHWVDSGEKCFWCANRSALIEEVGG